MKDTKYFRKGHMIYGAKDGKPDFDTVIFTGKSINDAKRESRKLQGSDLGRGVLRVIA